MDRAISRRVSGATPATVVVFALALLVGCGGDVVSSPPPTVVPTPTATPVAAIARIVVLGDSIAAGFGLAESDAFPAVVGRQLSATGVAVEVVNAGVSGDTTAGGLARLDWLLGQRPDVLVVELGGNDALRGQPLTSVEANLREIVRRAREGEARVVLLGMDIPTNYGPEYAGEFAAMYERVAQDEGAALVPGFMRQVGLDPQLMQPDGLHPTAAGQQRLAAELLPVLERLLPRPSL